MRLPRLIRNRLIGILRGARDRIERVRPRRAKRVEFESVQRRLELLLAAMFGEPLGDGLVVYWPSVKVTERSIVLPASLPDTEDAAERYRILAIQQGARIARGTRAFVPADPLERDLYGIIEAASIDAELVERAPGLSKTMVRLRREELDRRGDTYVDSAVRGVEALLRELLGAEPGAALPRIPRTGSPKESARAARSLASEMRLGLRKRAHYTAMDTVPMWDHDHPVTVPVNMDSLPLTDTDISSAKNASHKAASSKPNASGDGSDSDSEGDGAENDAGTPKEGASSGGGSSPEPAGAGSSDASAAAANGEPPDIAAGPAPGGVAYPEWVDRFKRLEPRYTTVFDVESLENDGAWASAALRDHARLIRQVRDRFAVLRARRLRLRAQRSGEELDLDACVNAMIDMRLKRVPNDRLYQTTRFNRQSLAFTILVDVSGSTKTVLPDGQRVIDVERLSVLLASEALASLGDPYSILAFTGSSRHNVQVATVKDFADKDLSAMHRRVSALEPGDNTRLGAAVRHATSMLLRQNAQRHVLLILSDGKPHDVDWYWETAAIEDSRIALLDARASGVHSFCITVDSTEAKYLSHLFGEGRYWVLADPAELPKALIRLIDTILTV
jgi:nitric oxide reductase NorD protein